jgi:large subunit ribosomal protein L25
MAEKTTFSAQPRTILGKKVKQLRKVGQVPANVTTPDEGSLTISMGLTAFQRLYTSVGDTGLVYLKIEGEKTDRPVLIDDLQLNPVTDIADHVVFRQVNLKEKLTAEVPVEVVGENKIPGTVIITVHDSIEVEALPTDFPENFTIDISSLTEIGQMVTFKQLDYDRSKVTLMISEEELDSPVVMLQVVKEEKEEVVEPTPVDGEAAPDATAGGDAAAAEGEAAKKAE